MNNEQLYLDEGDLKQGQILIKVMYKAEDNSFKPIMFVFCRNNLGKIVVPPEVSLNQKALTDILKMLNIAYPSTQWQVEEDKP